MSRVSAPNWDENFARYTMKRTVISMVHNKGHSGVDKTALLIRNNLYWRRMNDIENFFRECSISGRNKSKNAQPIKLVPFSLAIRPREVIAYELMMWRHYRMQARTTGTSS